MNIDLNDAAQYAIAAAIRGPDNEHSALKHITTAVVRYFAGMSINNGFVTVQSPEDAKTHWTSLEPYRRAEVRKLLNDYEHAHFMMHIRCAFTALEQLHKNGHASAHMAWLDSINDGAI